jgi:putative phosphoesterase
VRVAALYDVHGNVRALEAVLEEVGAANVDAIVFGGDLVWGAWPRETLELAQSLGERAQFLSGNMDRIALANREDASMRFVQELLTEDQRRFVASWPATLSVDGALYCHATPHSDEDVVTPVSSEAVWHEALQGVEEATVVCGHIHFQYDEHHAGHRVVNPGSIGAPTLRATAWWAVIGDDVELRTTDYDVEATVASMRESGFPRPDFADGLEAPLSYERVLEWWAR